MEPRGRISFEGTFYNGKRSGRGKYQLPGGRVEIYRYVDDEPDGDGVRLSSNRKKAWRVRNIAKGKAWRMSKGKVTKRITLEEAAAIAKDLQTQTTSLVPTPTVDEDIDEGSGSDNINISSSSDKSCHETNKDGQFENQAAVETTIAKNESPRSSSSTTEESLSQSQHEKCTIHTQVRLRSGRCPLCSAAEKVKSQTRSSKGNLLDDSNNSDAKEEDDNKSHQPSNTEESLDGYDEFLSYLFDLVGFPPAQD